MSRDIPYIAIILLLLLMLLTSNGRMGNQQAAHEDGLRLCETSTRILKNRIDELAVRVDNANAERIRLLGLTQIKTKRLD